MDAVSIMLFLLIIVILLVLIWWFSRDVVEGAPDANKNIAVLSYINDDVIESCVMSIYVVDGKKFLLVDKSLQKINHIDENNNVCLLVVESDKNSNWAQLRIQGNLVKRKEIDDIVIFELITISCKNTKTKISKTEISETAILDGVTIRTDVFGSSHFAKAVEYIQSM